MDTLAGKTCVVTGANSGLGKAISRQLAARGARLIMVCRSRERGQAAKREIEAADGAASVRLRLADLASLEDVRRAATELAAELDALDVLVNNAGVYRARLELTEDGFEKTLAVNHLGHYLFTCLLLDRIQRAAGRVINVSSDAHRVAELRRAPLESILRGEGEYKGFRAYADSKAANILFARELARRFGDAGVTAAAAHPGAVATRIWNQNSNVASLIARLFKPLMKSSRDGARPIVHLSADASEDRIQGRYFDRMEETAPAPHTRDAELAMQLWEISARLTGISQSGDAA